MPGNLGFQELLIILLIVLVLFGARRIPEVGKSLGKGLREFKKATREITADLDLEERDSRATTTPPTDRGTGRETDPTPPST